MARLARSGSIGMAFKVAFVFCIITTLCILSSLRSTHSREFWIGTIRPHAWCEQDELSRTEHKSGFPSPTQTARKQAVAAAFQHAWDGYTKHCFGHDTLHPVTNTCEDDFGGYGATAIDSLSTAIMFGNEKVTVQILEFIATLDLKVVKGGTRIQVFEVTIRHFAAMISAWDLLHGPFSHMATDPDLRNALYAQMIIMGDILSCAFDSPSGIPCEWVDPALCQSDKGTQNTIAGVGTVILEFARLSDITGNRKYAILAEKAENHLLNPQPASGEPYPGLLGSFVSVETGHIIGSQGSWGALSDSFYEYLLKAYLYNSDLYGFYLERWLIAADSTIRSIGSHPYGHLEWTLLPSWNGASLQKSLESLSWFAGGSFILGGMVTDNQTLVDYGLSIADAAGAIYESTRTGLGGEFVTWSTSCEASESNPCDPKDAIRISDGRFRLRPEVLETWYYAYRATKDEKYRDWIWAAFEAINRYCRTETGFSSITNVDAPGGGSKGDVQESFVFAEVMKYVYLAHLESYGIPDSVRMQHIMFKTVELVSRTRGSSIRKPIHYVSLVHRDSLILLMVSDNNSEY
ncbi:glycoside hydrolase [Aureobasidium sp. EXF-3400]|nr:glycoside hydrolase [Aureobasidium sp. EXF-12344]KAI4774276.1 glycoside hydrolase [Aureobasidium sp. EXF-3400]